MHLAESASGLLSLVEPGLWYELQMVCPNASFTHEFRVSSLMPSLTHVEGRSCHLSSEVICSFLYKITLDHATERKGNWAKLIPPQGGGRPLLQFHFVHGVQRSTPWEMMTMLLSLRKLTHGPIGVSHPTPLTVGHTLCSTVQSAPAC